jgi:hypothetical protein
MQAGIQAQDVLLAIDGEPVQTADQLAALLAAIPPDKQVRALIGRTEGVNEVTMTSRTRPPESRTPAQISPSQLADNRGLSASGKTLLDSHNHRREQLVQARQKLLSSVHPQSQSLRKSPPHDPGNPRQTYPLDFPRQTAHNRLLLHRQFLHNHRRLSNLQQLSLRAAQLLIVIKAELH